MKERLTAVNNNLTSAINSINDLQKDLFKQANDQKTSLLALLSQMHETYVTLKELSAMCKIAGTALLASGDTGIQFAYKVEATLDAFDEIPSGDFATFVDFCEVCGKELHTGDEYGAIAPFDVVCGGCLADIKSNLDPEEIPTPVEAVSV